MIGADVQQAISHTLRLTFLHNVEPFFYAGMAGLSILAALIRPTRARIIFSLAWTCLFLEFEYVKHIMLPLRDQTLITLTTIHPHYFFTWVVEKTITRFIPLGLLIAGWGGVIMTSLISIRAYRHGKRKK